MRAFYIIMIACALLIGGIALNRGYVRKFTSEARAELSKISFESADAKTKISNLSKSLNDHIKRVEFSISKDKSDSINDYLSLMESHLKTESKTDFEEARLMLDNLLKQIWELEEISFRNLF